MVTIPFLSSIIFPLGYIFYFWMVNDIELPKNERPFYKLKNRPYLLKNLFIAILFLTVGMFRINYDPRETFYFAPMIFLTLRVVFDPISVAFMGRPFIMTYSRMVIEDDQNFLDTVFTVLLFFLPLLFCGTLMNKINHGYWMN
jgi:hypothetical protein